MIKGEIRSGRIKGEIVPQISPLEPHMGSGGDPPKSPQIDEKRNGRATIDAIVYERTPAECEG